MVFPGGIAKGWMADDRRVLVLGGRSVMLFCYSFDGSFMCFANSCSETLMGWGLWLAGLQLSESWKRD